MFTGTNVYGPLFIGAAVILLCCNIWTVCSIWKKYVKRLNSGDKPSVLVPSVFTIVFVTVYLSVLTLGWNSIQSVTTNSSTYKSAAELREQKQVSEAQLPTKDEMDQNRLDIKQRADVKPHENALDSFDEKMRQVDEKIRNRSITQPSKNTVEKP